jgi:hypothetical protein
VVLMKRFGSALLLCALATGVASANDNERVQFGTSINVAENETVGDLVCIGCSIVMRGESSGDIVAVGGSVVVDGPAQDVLAVGGALRLGPNARVQDAVAIGGGVSRDPAAVVSGDVVSQSIPRFFGAGLLGALLAVLLFGLPLVIVLVLLAYLIAGQRRVETVAATIRTQAGMSILVGVGALALTVFAFWLASKMRPISGLVAVAIILVVCATTVLGYTGVSSWMGRLVSRSSGPLAAVLIGAILVVLIQAIPLVGAIALLVFLLMALGSAVTSGWGTASTWLTGRQV